MQLEIELPRGSDGKRRRRVVYGKTKAETGRKVAPCQNVPHAQRSTGRLDRRAVQTSVETPPEVGW